LGFWCNVERSEDDERKREKWGILADFKSCINLTPHQTRKDMLYRLQDIPGSRRKTWSFYGPLQELQPYTSFGSYIGCILGNINQFFPNQRNSIGP
jgi:hypothetical protein